MTVYLDLVILLNFLVDTLLILGVNRLTGYPVNLYRSVGAGALGGLYGGACLLPGFQFLGNFFWRIVVLFGIAAAAFGVNRSMLRRGSLFILLSMSLGGVAMGIGSGGFPGIICGAGSIFLLCAFGLQGGLKQKRYVTVELTWKGKVKRITALIDTGNLLSDPISGEHVLVVEKDIAREMVGLSEQQLLLPIQTMQEAALPGMRLIPYRTLGQPGGMLLAVRMDKVVVDGVPDSRLVAFAPTGFGCGNEYQALTGG